MTLSLICFGHLIRINLTAWLAICGLFHQTMDTFCSYLKCNFWQFETFIRLFSDCTVKQVIKDTVSWMKCELSFLPFSALDVQITLRILTALKLQQEPQWPWSLTALTAPMVLQSTLSGSLTLAGGINVAPTSWYLSALRAFVRLNPLTVCTNSWCSKSAHLFILALKGIKPCS